MSTELFPIPPPVRKSIGVRGIKEASKMNERDWQRLRTLVMAIAAEFLNTQDKYEHQDPEMVRLFYQTFHSEWPEVVDRYQMSWVLVRYLKVYLMKRVYRKRWSDKVARERIAMQVQQQAQHHCIQVCSALCIARLLDSQNALQDTGSLSVRHCNTSTANHGVATAVSRRATTYDESRSPSGSGMLRPPAIPRSTVIAPQHSGSSSSPASSHSHSAPVQRSETVFQFLQSTTPSLVKFVPEFLSAGIYDQNHLEDFLTWPKEAQHNFLLKTFRMNALELGALLMALNSRRRGPSDM
ncbi:hypothetical protein DFH29DRAFT_38589 [Suillus ampliporus]|nr:hypothetical protein DFH29DRAFT_38589 [Suillus ampliporus]